MRSLIVTWLVTLGIPSWADESVVDDGVDEAAGDEPVADSSGATAAPAERVAQLTSSQGPARTSPTPLLCASGSPRCLSFVTTNPVGNEAWDGLLLPRDVSGPAGNWRKKGRR